jgi:HEAT repeat protein
MEALEDAAIEKVASLSSTIAGLLSDRSSLVRAQAAETLGLIGAKSQLPALLKALDDADPLVRSYVAESVGLLGSSSLLRELRRRYRSEPNDQARLGFLVAMDSLGDRHVVRRILSLLASEDFEVRIAAARTLSGGFVTWANADTVLKHLNRAIHAETSVNARAHLRDAAGTVRRKLKRFRSRS